MKYFILILLASCVSQQPRPKTIKYRYTTLKQCPLGTVLYSDDVCRPVQKEQPAKIDNYMEMDMDMDQFMDIEVEEENDEVRVRPKRVLKTENVAFRGSFNAKDNCQQVFRQINQCMRGN